MKYIWIDDEPNLLFEIAKEVERQLPGLTIEFASTVTLGIKKIMQDTYDGIIIDLFLPAGNMINIDDNIISLVNKHGDKGGLVLLEILTNSELLSQLKLSDYDGKPIIVSSGYIFDILSASSSTILARDNVMILPKSDLILNNGMLL